MKVNLIGCTLFFLTKKSTAPFVLMEMLHALFWSAEPDAQFGSIPSGKADSSFKWKGWPL